MMHNVYNMPSGSAFLPALAYGLRDLLGERLPDALILLPTRRAVRALTDAFAGGSTASLLPQMRTLADIDPDEPPFEPGYLTGLVAPLMPPMQRRFELARLVARYHRMTSDLPLDPAGQLALADPLLAILDDAALVEVDLAGLSKLEEVEAKAARHFQDAATLYRIIQTHWPQYVAELGLMEPMARRVALLEALTRLWTESPPDHPVIIAGSTGTLKATARLMRCVAHMEQGMVILPGLDKALPGKSWKKIGPEHPQNSLKRLIKTIGIKRKAVPDWPAVTSNTHRQARRRVISESLVPVDGTADWPGRIKRLRKRFPGGDIFSVALEGLSIVEARTPDEEALAIAVMMRESLTRLDARAALITPDPALARRVKARLRRWQIEVDYSQGEPLEETALGGFLTGLLSLAQNPDGPVDLAFQLKHPLTGLGRSPQEVRFEWERLETNHYRGLRPDEPPGSEILRELQAALTPLMRDEKEAGALWAEALTGAAEQVAAQSDMTGADRLWAGEAGESAAALLGDLMTHAAPLGEMTLAEFARLFSLLMRGRVVRPRYGTHPRLQILGPLEARMVRADRIILGGLNEGVWPAGLSAQPFLSRGMRQALGLSLPERRYGLTAHDFAELASQPEVILTRSERGDDGPLVAARWLWRLKALVEGAGVSDRLTPDEPWLDWARALDHVPVEAQTPAEPPAHIPPVSARWPKTKDFPDGERRLSVTQIKTWIRDPYAIYGRYILGLKKLGHLDEPLGAREYGNAIHKGLEKFARAYPERLPQEAARILTNMFEAQLLMHGYPQTHLVRERERISRAAREMVAWMAERRALGWQYVRAEGFGELYLPGLDFTLTSFADLIEKGTEGYAATDYKTGGFPSTAVVMAGFDLQLPLTGLMLESGAFDDVPGGEVAQLLYLKVGGTGDGVKPTFLTSPDNKKGQACDIYIQDALEILARLVENFDDPATGYPSQPRIQYVNDYGDYDDLARRGEWAALGQVKPPT